MVQALPRKRRGFCYHRYANGCLNYFRHGKDSRNARAAHVHASVARASGCASSQCTNTASAVPSCRPAGTQKSRCVAITPINWERGSYAGPVPKMRPPLKLVCSSSHVIGAATAGLASHRSVAAKNAVRMPTSALKPPRLRNFPCEFKLRHYPNLRKGERP